MNQILMTENKGKKKKKKAYSSEMEIRNIVMFFAVTIMIFGLFLISNASYAMYRESKGNNTENLPTVKVARVNDTVIVTIESIETITDFKYSWNNSEETVIPVEDVYLEEEIFLPNENSILNITIEDETGRAVKFQKEFIIEGIDITKPSIQITEDEEVKGNIKITATDETQMSYIIYKVNDKDEIRIDRSEIENKTINYVLKLERGENILRITAVDTSDNIEEIEKKIIVSELPTLELAQIGNKLNVTIKDTDGLKDIEVNLNGVVYAGKDLDRKDVILQFELQEGKNTLKIKVVNVNSLVTEGVKEVNYVP